MTIIDQPFVLLMIPVVVGSLTLMGLVVTYHRAVGTWINRCMTFDPHDPKSFLQS